MAQQRRASVAAVLERARSRLLDLPVDWRYRGLVVVVGLLVYLPGLGDPALARYDEALYANGARHVVQHGEWLVPHVRVNYLGSDFSLSPRFAKPPLAYWLQAAAMLAFGVTAFAARLPSALATVGAAVLVYEIGRSAFDRWSGVAGSFVLLVLPPVYYYGHSGWTGDTDMLLTCFGSLFVWATWRGRTEPRWLVPAGVAAGLAVLTKGFAAGVFVAVLAPAVLADWRAYRRRLTAVAAAVTTAIALPWPLYAWRSYPEAFVGGFVARPVLRRAAGELTRKPGGLFGFQNFPYFTFFPQYVYPPFFALLLVGAAAVGRAVVRDGVDAHWPRVFLLWWVLAVPITFALAGGNHEWYLLPAVVPVAVLAGRPPALLARGLSRRVVPRSTVGIPATAVYVALGCCVVLALVAAYPPRDVHPIDREQREIGEAIDAAAPADATIHVVADRRGRVGGVALYPFSFYARRPLAHATIDRVNAEPDVRYAILDRADLSRLAVAYEVVAEGRTSGLVAVEVTGRASNTATDASTSDAVETSEHTAGRRPFDGPSRRRWSR